MEKKEPQIIIGNEGEFLKKIFCIECGITCSHKIVVHKLIDEYDDEEPNVEEEDFTTNTSYLIGKSITIQKFSQLISCKNCKATAIRKITVEKGQEYPSEDLIIPLRKDVTFKSSLKSLLSSTGNLVKLFEEAIICYNSNLNFSASAALRTLLEAICIDLGLKSNALNKLKAKEAKEQNIKVEDISVERLSAIERMIQLEWLVKDLIKKLNQIKKSDYSVLHLIREWGNEHIHQGKIPNSRDIKEAIMILEHVIEVLYDKSETKEQIFERTSSSFKSRR